MSLGLGVFLSSLFIGTLLLYRWTRDRWKWKKGLVRISLAAIGWVVILVIAVLAYQRYENRLTPQTRYYDVQLGMTQDTVTYVRGFPTWVLAEAKDGWQMNLNPAKLEKGKTIQDYRDWQFSLSENERERLDVTFSKATKTVSRIRCYSQSSYCQSVLGVGTGMQEEAVVERLC